MFNNVNGVSMIVAEECTGLKETHSADVADGDVSEGAGGYSCHSWSTSRHGCYRSCWRLMPKKKSLL